MRQLVWGSSFRRALKGRTRSDRSLQERILDTLDDLVALLTRFSQSSRHTSSRGVWMDCGHVRWNTTVESFSCLRRILKAARMPLYWLISAHTMKFIEDLHVSV